MTTFLDNWEDSNCWDVHAPDSEGEGEAVAPDVPRPRPAASAERLASKPEPLVLGAGALLARPSQFEGLTGAKPFRISEGYPRVFTTEKGGGDLFWRDLGGLDPGRRLRGECDPSLVQ